VLCVELEPSVAESAELTSELLALGGADARTSRVATIRYHPKFPVDIRHNSKIDRPALAAWVGQRP
jgi:olefin beta-lactone synthetase